MSGENQRAAVTLGPGEYVRVVEGWNQEFAVKTLIEWAEERRGGRLHLKVYIIFECGGERSESVFCDEEVSETRSFNYQRGIDNTMVALGRLLPKLLVTCAEKGFVKAADEGIRDDDYIPPRSQSDWSFSKLYNALDKALSAIPTHKPLTQENAAEIISRRYKLEPPLTKDALRMLLTRHGVDWKELKRREQERRGKRMRSA